MKKLLVANWKMNPQTVTEAMRLAVHGDAKGVVIAPPFPFLLAVSQKLKHSSLGAQDVFWENKGAYTGEISPTMLRHLGVRYVIVGHSEHRALGETDSMVARKVGLALEAGLWCVLCVGEPRSVRRKGFSASCAFVARQLKAGVANVSKTSSYGKRLIVAYEPVWAISTTPGKHRETADDAARMARHIDACTSRLLKTSPRVLYGGSVHAKNILTFLDRKEIDGVLVGEASTHPAELTAMVRLSAPYRR